MGQVKSVGTYLWQIFCPVDSCPARGDRDVAKPRSSNR